MLSTLKSAVAARSRRKRASLLNRVLSPDPSQAVLDLGGGKGRHLATFLPGLRNATIADFNPEALRHARETYGFSTRQVDGSEVLPFGDGEFDIVFCSSVIEHVTGPKAEAVALFKGCGRCFQAQARRHQQQFASEIRRIGRAYFVQTPARHFPVETHSWIPFIGAWPTHLQWAVIRVFNGFWPRRDEAPDWSLLTYADMRRLFPDAEIHRERFLGLTKSFIAIRAA